MIGVYVFDLREYLELYVVSVYCRYGDPIEPFMSYVEEVLVKLNNRPVMIGMDANAVSALWYSKIRRRANSESVAWNWLLEELILDKRLIVVNQPSQHYTFSTLRAKSDIDDTLLNQSAIEKYECSWEVLANYGLSDHSVIIIKIRPIDRTRQIGSQFVVPRWSLKDVDWAQYVDALRFKLNAVSLVEFDSLTIEEQVSLVSECLLNNECMRKRVDRNSTWVVWWTNELKLSACKSGDY